MSLPAALVSSFSEGALFEVLCFSSLHPLAPHPPGARFHVAAHDFDDFFLGYSELKFDGIEGGAVFPRHFNDAVEVALGKVFFGF